MYVRHILRALCLMMILPLVVHSQTGVWKEVDRVTFGGGFGITYRAITAGDQHHFMVLGDKGDQEHIVRASTDGGLTWRTVFDDSTYVGDDEGGQILRKFKLRRIATPVPRLVLITCDSGYVLRSEDWGQTWSGKRLDAELNIFSISVADSLFGLIHEFPAKIWRTADGGRSWSSMQIPVSMLPDGFGVSQVKAITSRFWLASLGEGKVNGDWYIARTSDAGGSWTYTKAASTVADFHMFDEQHGCVVQMGPQEDPTRERYADIVQLTEDGGRTWVTVLNEYITPAVGLAKVAFADRMNGIAVGASTKALRTTDGGWTWLPIMEGLEFGEVFSMTDIAFPTPATAFACAAKGVIYRYDLPSSVTPAATALSAISLYPVPASDELNISIEMPEPGSFHIRVVDMLGDQVLQHEGAIEESGTGLIRLDCSGLSAGGYIARIKAGEKIFIRKFEVVR